MQERLFCVHEAISVCLKVKTPLIAYRKKPCFHHAGVIARNIHQNLSREQQNAIISRRQTTLAYPLRLISSFHSAPVIHLPQNPIITNVYPKWASCTLHNTSLASSLPDLCASLHICCQQMFCTKIIKMSPACANPKLIVSSLPGTPVVPSVDGTHAQVPYIMLFNWRWVPAMLIFTKSEHILM